MDATSPAAATERYIRRGGVVLWLAYCGFISLGIPDTVAGVAWPGVRETFTLPQSGLGLVFIALGCGYLTSSVLAGKLAHWLGIGKLLVSSTALVAIAMFGQAVAPIWPVFVACGVIWGLGSGAIDAGLNAFAARHFSPKHVNWLHAFYSLGATLGPLLMTAMLLRSGSWRGGYALVGSVIALLGVAFLLTRRHWDDAGADADEQHSPVGVGQALVRPLVWLQIILFFIYTGLELMVGQWAFTLLTEARGRPLEAAGMLTSAYFGAIGVGRVFLGAIVERVGVDRLVRFALAAALGGSMLFAFGPHGISAAGLLLMGLGLSPVFPCLMSRTPDRLGHSYATHAVGFQVGAATTGAATLPALAGLLAQRGGLEVIPLVAVALAFVLVVMHETILRFPPRP